MEQRTVNSVGELIEVLGGPKATADKLDATPQMVVNWRATNVLPARKFLVQRRALKDLGIEAPVTLWGMAESADAQRRAG